MEQPCREKNWWEHYPLHQFWCNDLCPLVPRFAYHAGDEWNSNNWSIHWLIFNVWTLEHFAFGMDVSIQPDDIFVGVILPYLRITVGFGHVWNRWTRAACDFLRRKPAIKQVV